MPAARPIATFASAVPRVSWKWYACRSTGDAGVLGEGHDLGDLVRHAHADRVAEADLVGTEVVQPGRDVDGDLRLDAARCTGSRTRSRRRRAATNRGPAARARTGANVASDSVDRHADVLRRERVGRGGEDGDRIDPGRLGAGQAAHVRDEDRLADTRPLAEGAESPRPRRRAGGSPAATRTRSPRSRAGRPRRAAR